MFRSSLTVFSRKLSLFAEDYRRIKLSFANLSKVGRPYFASKNQLETSNMSTGVFRSLQSVLTFLEKHRSKSEVDELIKIYELEKQSSNENTGKGKYPLIVFEGLDGSGKSLLTRLTARQLGGIKTMTPPECIKHLRPIFNNEDTDRQLRRAFYFLGNYIAAIHVGDLIKTTPVVMDRFWHSTTANAIVEVADPSSLPKEMYMWPSDLLYPDLVVFLTVSEKVRLERMSRRTNYTPEEDQLKRDSEYRNLLTETFRKMTSPSLKFVNCDGVAEDVVEVVINLLNERRGLTI